MEPRWTSDGHLMETLMETLDGDPQWRPPMETLERAPQPTPDIPSGPPMETPNRDPKKRIPNRPLKYHQDPRKISNRPSTNCQRTPTNQHPTKIQRTPIVMKINSQFTLALKILPWGHAIIGDFNEGGRKLHKSQKVVNLFGIVFDLATLKQHTDPQITETVYIRADTGQVFLHMR